MRLNRDAIQRMINIPQGSGSVGIGGEGGSLAGIATEAWVEENYLSKAFFTRLFKAYGPAETEGDPDVEVEPNDLESDITSIEAMFGFWTEQYISALGQGSGGGGGGGGSDNVSRATMNLNASNNLVIGSGFASNNNTTTVYFANGVYLEWDSTNNAVKLNGSFYATGSVSALGASSSGTTYLDQATADARYLKLSGGQTMTGSFSGTSLTLSSQMKATNAVATAYLTVGTSSINTSYTLYVGGNAGIKNIVIGNEQQVNTVNCAVIQTLSRRGIYIKSGSAPNYVDGTWANASDIRLKDIVSNAGASVEQVADAPVFNYKWKAGGTQVMLGTSAQYWRNVFNFGVNEGPDSYLYMDYASIALASAVMVARKVQSHEERIAALEAENARLQKELNDIKAA